MSVDEIENMEYDSPIEAILTNEEVLLEKSEILSLALEENLHRVNRNISYNALNRVLTDILNEDIEPRQTADIVSRAVLYVIRYYYHLDDFTHLDDELKQWFRKSSIKFEGELDEARTVESIGSEAWMNIETTINTKDAEQGNFHYRHKVNTVGGEMTFSSSPIGLVNLIDHLLDKVKSASRRGAISDEQIEMLNESLNEVSEYHQVQKDQNDTLKDMLTAESDISEDELKDMSDDEIYSKLIKSING
jgi:hypothetical protein